MSYNFHADVLQKYSSLLCIPS